MEANSLVFIAMSRSCGHSENIKLLYHLSFKGKSVRDSESHSGSEVVNITGELGKWIEGNLLQEHYNAGSRIRYRMGGPTSTTNSIEAPSRT
jgi:hypothetical protein